MVVMVVCWGMGSTASVSVTPGGDGIALATLSASVEVMVVASYGCCCWMVVAAASMLPRVAMTAMVTAARMEVAFMILALWLFRWFVGSVCAQLTVKHVVSCLVSAIGCGGDRLVNDAGYFTRTVRGIGVEFCVGDGVCWFDWYVWLMWFDVM